MPAPESAADAAHRDRSAMARPSASRIAAPLSPAQNTGPTQKPGRPGHMADPVQLLIRRELLIADLCEAQRRHRRLSSIEAELRRVTLLALAI
jgi:hypothetical protein